MITIYCFYYRQNDNKNKNVEKKQTMEDIYEDFKKEFGEDKVEFIEYNQEE